ncbi:ion transporter [Halobacteriaceae archaeon GCM10025711]
MTAFRRHVERLARAAASETAVAFYERLVLALIVVNTAAVVLGTVDPLLNRYGDVFDAVEFVAVAAFTVEFVVRVGSRLARPSEGSGRLHQLLDPHLAVDLLAILPFYAGLAVGVGGLGSSSLVRVLRLSKLARYFEGDDLVVRVVRRKRADLAVSVFGIALLWLVAASSVYFAEHRAQPEVFSSIPEALWWAGVTITTVGYGDVYPVTPVGRLLGVVVALVGVGFAAIPSSILLSGILEETGPDRETCPHCGRRLDE